MLRVRDRRSRLTVARAIAIVLAFALNVAVFGSGVWALTNQQRIADQIAVWQFDPPVLLQQYVTATSMTDEGKFLFFASNPSVQSNPAFNSTCSNVEENFGVLGCYFPSDKVIYLFDVTDDRLAGIEPVVAAHEMLHAAWDRMPAMERSRLTPLLEAEAARLADDPEFTETLEFYAKTEPGERSNELHSIVGTEVAQLSPELEAHYATYFTDRSLVVTLHATSNAVFTAQQEASQKLVAQLDTLRSSIDGDYATYNSLYDELGQDIDSFNVRVDNGDFFSYEQSTSEYDALVSRQDALNGMYDAIEVDVSTYDDLVAQLDALNATTSELNRSINIEPRTEDGL